MSGQKPREIAARVLAGGPGADYVEDRFERIVASAELSPVDRRLCQELVYGTVRWQATLDWLIARKTGSRRQRPTLLHLLRLGLYQIFWLERIPNHAAVNETVELAKQLGLSSQAGFVNAVLRGYLRESDATRQLLADLKQKDPPLGYSHPAWLTARWEKRWGRESAAQLMTWNNTPPKTFARINTLKADPAKLLVQWRDEDVEYDFVRHDWFEENLVFELKSHPPLTRLPSFQQGQFYIQDPSTLLAVQELAPQPGETILDLCAAPGGKLTYLAQLMHNEGHILAQDVSAERLDLVAQNCQRLGVTNVEYCLASEPGRDAVRGVPKSSLAAGQKTMASQQPRVVQAQAASLVPLSPLRREGLGERGLDFSRSEPEPLPARILVDAPCSNTGVMRRRVDLRWRLRPEEIDRSRRAQLDLLRHAAEVLKPGGVLVYSTCSLEPEENQEVVQEFLRQHPDLTLERERELLPFRDTVDGAYVARLSKHLSP